MYRYQILIEYVGTNFVGWQIQSKGRSIQKLIQTKLSKILKEKILLVGSGRTDAGVHAIAQSAHFECKKEIQDLNKFLKSINHFVNNMNISIIRVKKKNLRFHARFSAKERVYKYVIFNRLSRPSIFQHHDDLILVLLYDSGMLAFYLDWLLQHQMNLLYFEDEIFLQV